MIKNECEIVKDLVPSYIENLVSEGTKEFVEKHIKTCDSCKDTLENKKKEKEQKEEKEKQKGKFEISYLKKYNKKLEILKTIIFIIAIVLGVVCLATLGNVVKWEIERGQLEKKGKQNQEMIHKIVGRTNDMISQGDFILTLEKKDNIGKANETVIKYTYKATNDKFIEKVFEKEELKSIKYLFRDENDFKFKGIEEKASKEINLYEGPIGGIQRGIVNCMGFLDIGTPYLASKIEIKEEEYNGKKCKVLKRNDGSYDYELWIEKDTNLIARDILYIHGKLNEEKNYKWEIREISDEEIFEGKSIEEIQSQYDEIREGIEVVKKIVEESSNKMEAFLESNNYTYTVEVDNFMELGKLKEVYNVKNGKVIKKVYLNDIINENQVTYGYKDKNYLRGVIVEGGEIKQSKIIEQFDIPICKDWNFASLSRLELKEEVYAGKECYVVKDGDRTMWIDKESKLMIKDVSENVNSYFDDNEQTWKSKKTITTTTYTWEKDNIEGELFDDEMLRKVKEMYNKM